MSKFHKVIDSKLYLKSSYTQVSFTNNESDFKTMIRSKLASWREYLTPVTHTSTFQSSGQITPEEFTQAGDYLCHMFPTWEWNSTSKDVSYRDFLPKEKQFLVTRKVPCSARAEQLTTVEGAEEGDNADGWVVEGQVKTRSTEEHANADIEDMLEGMDLEEVEQDDDDMVAIAPNDRRFYDLYITYSTSYRVPKIYLVGFNGDGSPLTPEQMFEDISPDYRTKTATIERLPFQHTHVTSVSIHPCKHANVMRVLMERIREVKQRKNASLANTTNPSSGRGKEGDEGWEDIQNDVEGGLRVDQYLIVFLKFVSSVTPGIEHDYTMEGW